MKVYLKDNVVEASKKRISWLFDEFEQVAVAVSGGKDSTVILDLVLKEAQKRGVEKTPVVFLDQEAEWPSTIEWIKKVMYDKRVKPIWFQGQFRILNATSFNNDERVLWCWKDGEEWLRDKDPIAIKENIFGEYKFAKLFDRVYDYYLGDKKTAVIYGIRAEENPRRFLAVTEGLTYKNVTWGSKTINKQVFIFSPIYDWSYTDIWKYINENKLDYNKLYDLQYQLGITVHNMRVSNLHHETALKALEYLPEIDAKFYSKLVKRLGGVHAYFHFKDYKLELPYMFKNWKEYRDFLLEKLITEDKRDIFRKKFDYLNRKYHNVGNAMEEIYKAECRAIIRNDWDDTSIIKNLETSLVWKYKNNKNLEEYRAKHRRGAKNGRNNKK